jgi:hypothetical protein
MTRTSLFVLISTCALVPMMGIPSVYAAGNWATTKVTDGNAGPYCAVSRKIDNTVVTIGRTARGESSLALEMKDAGLDPAKLYRVSVKPGASERLEIETKPINASTFVLNVDRIVDLQTSFKASPTLQVKYADRTLSLLLNDWAHADAELGACLSSLGGGGKPVVTQKPTTANPVTDVAVAPIPPVPVVNRADVKRIESLLNENQVLRQEIASLQATNASGLQQASVMAAECDAIKAREKALNDQITMLKSAKDQAGLDAKAMADVQARVAALATENATLKTQLETAQLAAKTAAAIPVPAPMPIVATDDAEKKALKAERDRLAVENTELSKKISAQASDLVSTKTLADEIARLKVERDSLQTKLTAALAVPKTAKTDAADAVALADLRAKIDGLERERLELQSKLLLKDDGHVAPDVADLERRLEMMSAENVKLRADLALATMPENDMRAAVAAEAPLRQQLRTVHADNQALKAKVDEMQKLLDSRQRDEEKTLLGASGQNWDLEKATRRLQETERDVQRLSIALRDQKAQCDAQKKQIEYMLFDPKLAKDGQIALLNSLEDQIAELRAVKGLPPAAPAPAIAAAQPVLGGGAPVITSEPLGAPAALANVTVAPGAVGFTSLLKQAGVSLTSTLSPVAKNPFGPGKAWRYESGALAGLVVEQATVKPSAFDSTVQKQMKGLKSACKGDFAAEPAASNTIMGVQYSAIDAACISGENSTSAAVLFYQKNGTFNVISHEAAPDSMALAMDARDKVITTLVGK